MAANYEVDLNKLTAEAEAGHGHFVKTALQEMSFQERIRILHKMQDQSSRQRHKQPDDSYLTFSTATSQYFNCACIELDRNTPHKDLFGLMDRREVVYADNLDLYTGDETLTEGNIALAGTRADSGRAKNSWQQKPIGITDKIQLHKRLPD